MSLETNIACWIDKQACERPFQRALVLPEGLNPQGRMRYSHLTFLGLVHRINAIARGLSELGLRQGDRVSVFIRPGVDFPSVIFALFKLGAIPVFIDPGMGRQQVFSCIQRMAPRALIAEPQVMALAPFLGKTLRSVDIKVSVGRGWWGATRLDQLIRGQAETCSFPAVELDPDEEAAVLFTSGSTGPAKGVRYSHRILIAQTRLIRDLYDIQPGEVDMPGLPVFALFSLAMGATVLVPPIEPTRPADLDPAAVVGLMRDQAATMGFGSPAIWKPIFRYCQESGLQLPTLKRILSAGAPVPVWMHEASEEILEDAQIHTPYGATESLPVASISTREVLRGCAEKTRDGAGTCVGRLAPELELAVVPIHDEPIPAWHPGLPLPQGEIGEICVTGPAVTRAYVDEPEANALSKIPDGERVWHRIGDLGYLDEEGRLWFCGRKSHRVMTPRGLLCPVRCEGILNEHPGLERCAVVGLGEVGEQEPVLCLELREGADADQVRAEVLKRAAAHPLCEEIQRALIHPGFPVDVRHNAKIKREVLAVWAAERLS